MKDIKPGKYKFKLHESWPEWYDVVVYYDSRTPNKLMDIVGKMVRINIDTVSTGIFKGVS